MRPIVSRPPTKSCPSPPKNQFPCGDYQLDVFEGDAVDDAPIYSTSAHCDGYRVAQPEWNDQFSNKEGDVI